MKGRTLNDRRGPGCIEAAYAVFYGWSLILLVWELFQWARALCSRLLRIPFGTLSQEFSDQVNALTLELFACISIVAAVLQFARIYHYIHEFDHCQDCDDHFISFLTGRHRCFDRALRWAAGICVIITIEIWGHNRFKGSQEFLSDLAISLFLTFLFLALWDWNLRRWLEKLKTSSGGQLPSELTESLNKFEPRLKRDQRFAGMVFSSLLFAMLRMPTMIFWTLLCAVSVGWFFVYWIRDYHFGDNWRKGLLTLMHETLSPLWTIWKLFAPSSSSLPRV